MCANRSSASRPAHEGFFSHSAPQPNSYGDASQALPHVKLLLKDERISRGYFDESANISPDEFESILENGISFGPSFLGPELSRVSSNMLSFFAPRILKRRSIEDLQQTDESVETEYHSCMTSPVPDTPAPTQETLLEALQQFPRHRTRPIAEISSLLNSPDLESSALNAGGNTIDWLPSQTPPFLAPEFTNFFEMSQDLEMGILPAYGLGFEGEHAVMTSTPCQGKKWGLGLRCRLESETKSRKQHQEYQIKIHKQALEAHEYRIVELAQQCQYALDNVSRLNEKIRRRDAEARQHCERALRRGAELEALRERISQMNYERAEARKANEPIASQSAVAQITQQRAPDGQDQRLNIPNNRKQLLQKRRMAARPSKIPYYRRDSEVLTTLGVASASGTEIAPLSKSSRLSNNSSIASSVPAVPSGPTFVRFGLPVQSPRPFGRTTGAVVEVRRNPRLLADSITIIDERHLTPATDTEIDSVIMSSSAWKAPERYGVQMGFVQRDYAVLRDRIRPIFKALVALGSKPTAYKSNVATPLHKAGKKDKTSPKSWRSVENYDHILAKPLEHLIADRIFIRCRIFRSPFEQG
ncbi:hypothetical protein B0H13DRAFT_2478479 [Mycena leptocephala]|nr:hypothetical protein B0H13DRAFT_2478479 [Mycena leptocephala]